MSFFEMIGSAASGIFGAESAASGQRGANRMSRLIAKENREFQRQMSNTAVRRRMRDMRLGGINPLLAARYDASTPAGAMAVVGNVGLAAMQGLQAGVTSGASLARLPAELGKFEAEIQKIEEEIELIGAQMGWTEEQTRNTTQLTRKALAETENLRKTGQAIDYELIVNAIVTEFKQEHPNLTIAQAFGLDATGLTRMVSSILGGLGVGALMKPKRTNPANNWRRR